jgi:histidinol-phosphatase (PHP family)
MTLNNYHTHTNFCDGSDDPEMYVLSSIKKGFKSIGFSGHAPIPVENTWSIRKENLENYCKAIENLKEKYSGKINIFLGLEADYIPGISTDFSKFISGCKLDYTIGSVHLVRYKNNDELWFIDGHERGYITGLKNVFDNNIQLAVETYYNQICEMAKTQKPDIIGHFDKIKMNNKGRFFSEDEEWYKKTISKALKFIAGTKCIIEVNTRGIYKKKTDSLFPSVPVLEECFKLKIPVTVNSDTHSPEELTGYFSEAYQILKNIGYKKTAYLTTNGWKNQIISYI